MQEFLVFVMSLLLTKAAFLIKNFILVKCIAVTLVDSIIQVSGIQLSNRTPVCSSVLSLARKV